MRDASSVHHYGAPGPGPEENECAVYVWRPGDSVFYVEIRGYGRFRTTLLGVRVGAVSPKQHNPGVFADILT